MRDKWKVSGAHLVGRSYRTDVDSYCRAPPITIGFSNEAALNDGTSYISEGMKRPILCFIFLASETITLVGNGSS
jgi:hypothetical protein